MRNFTPAFLIVALTWAAASGVTVADTWSVDHERSRLTFEPTWEGIPFEGAFQRFRAQIEFDPDIPSRGRFDVVVDISGADAGGADMNEGMALPEFFDTARHPEARFVTTEIVPDSNAYLASGELTVKGITRAVVLPFVWDEAGQSARLHGELVVDRTDFNVGEGQWSSGESIGVKVRIIVDLILTHTSQ